jgi:NAD(P)H-flavin reductase
MKVYLLWLNDSVLDVYSTEDLAQEAARIFREKNPGKWRGYDIVVTSDFALQEIRCRRWWQEWERWSHTQTIARLEVEERTVTA